MTKGLTAAVTDMVTAIRPRELPERVVTAAKHCLLDWTGVALAGSNEPVTSILRDTLSETGGSGTSTVFGSPARLSVRDAVLVNGTSGHALDFDDVVGGMGGHPSAPVVPAVLAVGERLGSTGGELIAAVVAGIEAESRIAQAVNPGHYRIGWHTTATVGTFGAAAACAHLMGLQPSQVSAAIGVAASQASGLKSMFGSMCKPLQVGDAAASGAMASLLAARGFTSASDALEAPQGFASTTTDTFCAAAAPNPLGEPWYVTQVLFKYHAACFLTHATIEGVLQLKKETGLSPSAVERIVLRVPAGHLNVCNIVAPRSGLEAKFSLRYTAAAALVTGDLSEAAFGDEAVMNPHVEAVRQLIDVQPVTDLPNHTSETLVELKDGSSARRTVDMERWPRTTAELDAQGERLAEKFMRLAAPVVGAVRAKELMAAIDDVEHLPSVADLTRLCRSGGAEW